VEMSLKSLSIENFLKFNKLDVPKIADVQLFMGNHGSGKTSLLWSIVLLLRSFNTRLSKFKANESTHVILDRTKMPQLLNFSGLKSSTFSDMFLHNDGTAKIRAELVGIHFSCELKANETLELSPSQYLNEEKIRFVLMDAGATANFISQKNGRAIEYDELSVRPNVRNRYLRLPKESKDELLNSLKNFFPIQSIEESEGEVFIIEESGDKMEVTFSGSSFRKAFTTLVLLFTLAKTKERNRILLIEEPEALISPSLTQSALQLSFLTGILELSRRNGIQLIFTSNSHIMRSLIPPQNIFLLGSPNGNLTDDHLLHLIEKDLLFVSPHKKLILCEGPNDPLFLQKLAKLAKKDIEQIQFFPMTHNIPANQREGVVFTLKKIFPNISICFLQSSDFSKTKSNEQEEENGTQHLYWDLPSVENYLFIHECHKTSKPDLKFLKTNPIFAKKFSDEFKNASKDEHGMLEMFTLWTTAMKALDDDPNNLSTFLTVAKVLHGRTWVKKELKTTTNELISNVTEDIFTECPKLLDIVEQIFSE